MGQTSRIETRSRWMHVTFAGICLVCIAIGHMSLYAWLRMSHSSEQSSNLWIIPLISGFILYERRHAILVKASFNPWALIWVLTGFVVQVVGLLTYQGLGSTDATVLAIIGFWIALTGAFIACYGSDAWKHARFAMAFLLFAIPFPEAMLARVVRWLQDGSALVVQGLFSLLAVPFWRDGFTFHLSGLTIDIAPECSGIRSSYALLVLGTLLAYFFLRGRWTRALLIAAVVPLAMIKNGIRIVTLCLLTMNVDASIIDGPLHHRGGFVFFGIAFAMEGALCWLLNRHERRGRLLLSK